MRYLSVCSGIEAATVAWHQLGWTPVAFSEIEPFPSAVLKHHYPEVPNLGDMTKHAAWPLQPGDIDILVGGTPCQSFSVAGLRKGLSDPRGGLMLTYLEIARRLRPRWIVWENVPGILSSGSGRDFGSFLGALGELGYGWAYRVLDAQWVRTQRHPRAVPQRRRRVFVVGCLGDAAAAAAVLFERESVCRDTAPRGAPRQGAAVDAEGGARADGIWWDGSDCAATLTKQNANGAQRMPDKDNFGAVIQPIVIDRAAFNQGENAAAGHLIAVPIQDGRDIAKEQNGLGIGASGDPAYTLDTTGAQACAIQGNLIGRDVGGPQGVGASDEGAMYTLTKADVHAVATIDMQACKGNANIGDGSVSPTLCKPSGSDVHAVAFDWQQGNDVTNPRPSTMNVFKELTPTLGTTRTPAVAHGFYSTGGTHGVNQHPEVSPAVKVGSGLGIPSPPAVAVAFSCKDHGADAGTVSPTMRAMPHDGSHANGGGQLAMAHAMTVRRLTPRECERLQAFPDDYTMIPWRGKYAADCPDGPRYKALGNSMAVNCMEWIGERIAAWEARK